MSNARTFFGSRSSSTSGARLSLPRISRQRGNPQGQARNNGQWWQDDEMMEPPIELDERNVFDSPENFGSHPTSEVARADQSTLESIKILLQQQQALLQTVMAKQEAFETFQARFEKKFEEFEEKITSQSQTVSSSDSSPSGSKRKRVVTRELTVSILLLCFELKVLRMLTN